jgi:hypothetical protein
MRQGFLGQLLGWAVAHPAHPLDPPVSARPDSSPSLFSTPSWHPTKKKPMSKFVALPDFCRSELVFPQSASSTKLHFEHPQSHVGHVHDRPRTCGITEDMRGLTEEAHPTEVGRGRGSFACSSRARERPSRRAPVSCRIAGTEQREEETPQLGK